MRLVGNAKGEGFYKVEIKTNELVKLGSLEAEEYGIFVLLATVINPNNGYWLGNFSIFAGEFNLDSDRVGYVFKKLTRRGLIVFSLSRGQRSKAKFFINGYQMKTLIKGQDRFVTPEYIQKMTIQNANPSEVKNGFQKSKWHSPKRESSHQNKKEFRSPLDVNGEGNVILNGHGEGESERGSPPSDQGFLFKAFEELKANKGEELATKYFLDRGYEIPKKIKSEIKSL